MDTLVVPVTDPIALPGALQEALDILRREGLVAFPTDTVYGLGALAHEPASIERLYAVKGRDASKAIPILISDLAELEGIADRIDVRVRRLAEKYWPGPLTLVVPRHPSLPDELTPYPTVGVRIPDHPVALGLIRLTGPLAVTSANLSGQPSAVTAGEVLAHLRGSIELILDGGETPGGISSTVVDCSGAELTILRQGPVSREELERTLREN
jgi:L-threonylcarbamoyladenylate synthase